MRVLLGYDGSAGAEQAVALLLSLRWPAGTTVRVISALEPTSALVPAPLPGAGLVMSPDIEAEIRRVLESDVENVVDRLGQAGLDAAGAVLYGRPATVLADEARDVGADLIVVGSRGHGPIASLVLGSVSAELVDHAPSPVLVVRRTTADRVLFATDGSPSALGAERLLTTWPIFESAAIRVVSVADVPRPWHTGVAPTMVMQVTDAYAKDLERAKHDHEALARETSARLEAADRRVDSTLRVGDAAAEIVEEAAAWSADLVVLGSRGLTGVSRFVLGSVARNVLQGTQSSVLIVRESGSAPT
ncbi:MAG TPA: universal stress protein [Candidatus Limnocylindrales bacterium]|nr:universal stress protein [Candidatus Limnocylindrales bacterium]